MDYIELLEAQIKGGKRLTFTWEEDLEKDRNRGFILHKIGAVLDGAEVGYLKIAYIPKERFVRYYPTIFNYLCQIGGWSELPYEKQTLHYNELTDEELKRFVRGVAHRMRDHIEISDDRTELLKTAAALEKEANRIHKTQFKKFIKFQVDCPYVGYIDVTGGKWEPTDYRRLGIGTALYLEGARRMAERGLRLHASGIQSKEAKAVWDRLTEKGWVAYDNKTERRYLTVSGK
jgi:hypothetical protein